MRTKEYTGIDLFRLAAAFLMVAIHTSPLADVSETGDFILTRVLARVGVPFFFMTSGFFLISRDVCHMKRLWDFEKKTSVIYGAAILLYLPINVYQGYFQTEHFLPTLLRDLVFDGTLYHLWYLPAAMLGAMLAWGLVRRFGERRALAAAAVLYLIGLFGDSYYGLAEQLSGVRCFYTQLFLVSDHTRNGIFFAPLFFLLGGILAQKERKRLSVCVEGFCVSFCLMLAEALLLRHFSLQRHDSMYLFLPFCMYFLFGGLLHIRGKRLAFLRDVSLVIYLIHPLVIVMLRPAARLLGLWELLVENSVVHFLMVGAISAVFAVGGALLRRNYQPKREVCNRDRDRAYLEINVNNLAHNIRELRRLMQPGCELMAVVKAEAYGHGMYETAAHLNRMGVRAFAVATIDEGIRLRLCGILGEILVLGYTPDGRVRELVKYDLTQTLVDLGHALRLNAQRRTVKVHIKVDTGMHRLGFAADETEVLAKVCKLKYLKLCGIYTHLCVSDSLQEEDVAYTRGQVERFYRVLDALKKEGITIPAVHIQSSYGLLNYPELKCDYVRAGIALYGVLSHAEERTIQTPDLRPVLSLKSRVVLLRSVKSGESVGYGRAFVAQRGTQLAVLPVGYADGYPRELSCGKGGVLINGCYAPVVGRVCMDQLTVDVTDIPNVRVGSEAVLIGEAGGEKIFAPRLAGACKTITNELLSRMGSRLTHVIVSP